MRTGNTLVDDYLKAMREAAPELLRACLSAREFIYQHSKGQEAEIEKTLLDVAIAKATRSTLA